MKDKLWVRVVDEFDHVGEAIKIILDEKNMFKSQNEIMAKRIENLVKIIELKDNIIEGQDQRIKLLEGLK